MTSNKCVKLGKVIERPNESQTTYLKLRRHAFSPHQFSSSCRMNCLRRWRVVFMVTRMHSIQYCSSSFIPTDYSTGRACSPYVTADQPNGAGFKRAIEAKKNKTSNTFFSPPFSFLLLHSLFLYNFHHHARILYLCCWHISDSARHCWSVHAPDWHWRIL